MRFALLILEFIGSISFDVLFFCTDFPWASQRYQRKNAREEFEEETALQLDIKALQLTLLSSQF